MAKALTKKDLEKFRALLETKREAVYQNAKKTLTDNMVLDPNDLADEMDLASSEALQSFEFRLRGREKKHLAKIEEEVLTHIDKIGADEHFTMIFGKIGLLYASDAVDITSKVIERLNRK